MEKFYKSGKQLIDKTGHTIPFENLTYGLASTKLKLKASPFTEYILTGIANINGNAVILIESKNENLLVSVQDFNLRFKLI